MPPYYNGLNNGSGPNPAAWTTTSTISTNATASYGTDNTGFSDILNAVTVPSIQIYNKSNLAPPPSTWLPPPSPPLGRLHHRPGDRPDVQQRSHLEFSIGSRAGSSPAEQRALRDVWSEFVHRQRTNGSAPYVNSSVLGQSGWAVVANTGTASAQAILGLNSAVRNQFTPSVDWTATGADQFPNSSANSSTEFGGGKFHFELSGGANPVTWTNGTLLDTGTQNNHLNA